MRSESVEFGYDSAGLIVYSERYEYDKNGNRMFSEENGKIRDYWYDENNRLKKKAPR